MSNYFFFKMSGTRTAGEDTVSLFQEDILLPAQFLETLCRKTPLDPEKRLMLAVLNDAVCCYQSHLQARDRKGRRLFQEAEEWILDQDGDWPFSFENICETLGFDPGYLRAGLLRWKERSLARPSAKISQLEPWVTRTGRLRARANGHRLRHAAVG